MSTGAESLVGRLGEMCFCCLTVRRPPELTYRVASYCPWFIKEAGMCRKQFWCCGGETITLLNCFGNIWIYTLQYGINVQ